MTMQNKEKISEIASNFAKKILPLSKVKRAVMVQNFAVELREKSFAESYELLYYLALFVASVSQILSVWSSYLAVANVVAIKGQSDLTTFITLLILCTIEAVKFALVRVTLGNVFSLRPKYPHIIIVISLLWSLGSMYLCVSGSSQIAKDSKGQAKIATDHAQKETALKNEIATIQNTDAYKTIVWNGQGTTSKMLTEVGKGLVQKREVELDSLRKNHQVNTQNFDAAQKEATRNYNYFFAIFEGLFLFATIGAYYYKRTCAIEKIIAESVQSDNKQYEVTQTLPKQTEVFAQSEPQTNKLQTDFAQTPNEPQSEVVRTESLTQNFAPILRSETIEVINEPTFIPENEADYLALIEKFTNGKRAYLESRKPEVKTILECRKLGAKTGEIERAVMGKHAIGKSTFHKILSHIKEVELKNE